MSSIAENDNHRDNQGLAQELLLKFTSALPSWRGMAQVMGLRRLQELFQGTCSLSNQTVWLLGVWYGVNNHDIGAAHLTPELEEALLLDFRARLWFTYRREFPAIGGSGLTSDVGWGCTLRSGQMMLAEVLTRHLIGRRTRPPLSADGGQDDAAAVARVVALFHDGPSPVDHPFSIHNICRLGAPHGVVAGQWLGPWVLCHALQAAVVQQQQQQQQQQRGLIVHVVCSPGGGAPSLQPASLRLLFSQGAAGGSAGRGVECDGVTQPSSGSSVPCTIEQSPQHQANGSCGGSPDDSREGSRRRPGLLLLVPLTLGVGKVNDVYLPQLRSVLSFPQSVGVVGGRPGASLYFVGHQDPGAVLFLDPHEVKEVAELPRDLPSFSCPTPRVMPISSIDPSLAIGFYCSGPEDLEDLCGRLGGMAAASGNAPLMTVDTGEGRGGGSGGGGGREAEGPGAARESRGDDGDGGGAEDWEML